MRKWKELSKKEKAKVIFTGALGVIAAGGICTTYVYSKELHKMMNIPSDYPRSTSRISYRSNLPKCMQYALEIFYVKEDKSAGKFMGEIAFESKEELSDFGKWISETALTLGGENNETVY